MPRNINEIVRSWIRLLDGKVYKFPWGSFHGEYEGVVDVEFEEGASSLGEESLWRASSPVTTESRRRRRTFLWSKWLFWSLAQPACDDQTSESHNLLEWVIKPITIINQRRHSRDSTFIFFIFASILICYNFLPFFRLELWRREIWTWRESAKSRITSSRCVQCHSVYTPNPFTSCKIYKWKWTVICVANGDLLCVLFCVGAGVLA